MKILSKFEPYFKPDEIVIYSIKDFLINQVFNLRIKCQLNRKYFNRLLRIQGVGNLTQLHKNS